MTKVKQKLGKFFSTNCLVVVFILVFFLRLPSLFEPFTYGDEGIYLTLGQALRQGLTWYRDIHDNKPPMLYLLAAIADNFAYYRLILFIWSLATIFAFYKLVHLVFPKNKPAIIASTTIFAVLTSLHVFESNVGNAENFMLLPTIVAFYLILKIFSLKLPHRVNTFAHTRCVFSGFLLGLATLFKIPAAFDFAAALIFGLLLLTFHFTLLVGFTLPILLSITYYASKGALYQYLSAAFFQNIPYLSSWIADKPQVGDLPLSLLGRGFLVLSLILGLYIFRKKISLVSKLILVWFVFSWFAALLSSRPYPHYLIQILPAFSLSFGLFFSQQKRYFQEKIIPVILLLTLIVTWITFRFWYYANFPYYYNFYSYVLKQKTKSQYFAYFGKEAENIYQTAKYINERTLPGERIFIWGNEPSIYALARRLPVSRYTVAYHIIDFNGYQETMDALTKNPPRYLIVIETEKRPFPELFNFIELNYLLEKKIDSARIFHQIF